MANKQTPSDVVARRVRDLRKRRGLTAADLAARCAEAGMPKLTAQALYKLEGQRSNRPPRPVTVDELLVLAVALNVSPLHLLVPPYPSPLWGGSGNQASDVARPPEDPNVPNDAEPYPVTPGIEAPHYQVRQFIRGWGVLPGMDAWDFYRETPPHERPGDDEIQRLVDGGPRKRWMTGD